MDDRTKAARQRDRLNAVTGTTYTSFINFIPLADGTHYPTNILEVMQAWPGIKEET